ncbi:hypothetical protein NQ317_017097 [Molorchus minor]|uniref:Aldehyde dehydrogenase domain-containing protein n=1 Tax=Molorchus minor TaxID=1323400 RepID=A0ABQ9IWA3_9CUCU|nr:hypothetical protein NQ317_017097 [Molorchus minor]
MICCKVLAAGNAVILKPSELSSSTADVMAKYLPKYFDPECVQVLGKSFTKLLHITPTTLELEESYCCLGLGAVSLASFFPERLIIIANKTYALYAYIGHLHNPQNPARGKSPLYLDETADMEIATRRIFGANVNSGQTCIAWTTIMLQTRPRKICRRSKKVITEFYGSDPRKSPYLSK